MMRDADFGLVRLRAFGTYDFRIVDAPKFLREVAGTDQNFRLDEFAETMRSRIVSVFTEALATAKIPALDIATRYSELGEALVPIVNPIMQGKYGIEVTAFVVENVSVPPEVEQAIDKRSGMAAVGNLNDYVKFQMASTMGQGGGSVAAAPAEMAMGFAMAQQMMQGLQQPAAATPPPLPPAPAAPALDVLTPEQAAQALGVSVEDVVSTLEKGELKGRKIGNAWRIARASLDEYLRGA